MVSPGCSNVSPCRISERMYLSLALALLRAELHADLELALLGLSAVFGRDEGHEGEHCECDKEETRHDEERSAERRQFLQRAALKRSESARGPPVASLAVPTTARPGRRRAAAPHDFSFSLIRAWRAFLTTLALVKENRDMTTPSAGARQSCMRL